MGLMAAILWGVFVTCGGWEAVGLRPLDFWTGVLVVLLGVFFIGAVERN